MPVSYENGKIYQIICPDGQYYIGSTTSSLDDRFRQHKMHGKQHPTRKLFQTIYTFGWDKVHIQLIEDYPCKSKDELTTREDFFIKQAKQNDPMCLNVIRAHVTEEEVIESKKAYYEAHKDEIKEKHIEYYADPVIKEKTDQYQAEYRLKNAEKRREYSKKYIEEHPEETKNARKVYYETHKEEFLQKCKVYTEKNKERVAERKRLWAQKKKEETAEQIAKEQAEKKLKRQEKTLERKQKDEAIHTCECGGTYQPYRKSRHDTSKKHMKFMNASKENLL